MISQLMLNAHIILSCPELCHVQVVTTVTKPVVGLKSEAKLGYNVGTTKARISSRP